MPDLCHCPLCGGHATITLHALPVMYAWTHVCHDQRGIVSTGYPTLPAAFEAWQVWCTGQATQQEEERHG